MGKKINSTRSVLMRICLIAMIIAMMCSITACRQDKQTVPTDHTELGGDKSIFANNTWAEIADACKKNAVPDTWKVGDTKEMEIDGQKYTVAIIGKNHDTYANGGIAPLTFQVIDLFSNCVMNDEYTNSKAWAGSDMYSYLNNEEDGLINLLPNDVKNNIKAVVKKTNLGGDDAKYDVTTVTESHDKLFLLACTEIAGDQFWDWYADAYCDYMESTGVHETTVAHYRKVYENFCKVIQQEGDQYAYYAPNGTITNPPTSMRDIEDRANINYWYNINASTLSDISGVMVVTWWLRTPGPIHSGSFASVDNRGNVYEGFIAAQSELGISFAFCF